MILPLDSIVERDRVRRSVGDVRSLAESIRERGLLHPPVVRKADDQWVLVAGARRLAALRLLDVDAVNVTIAHCLTDEIAALAAEGEENTERADFTPSEAVALAERIEKMIAARAKERQGTRTDLQPSAESAGSYGETREQVAAATGIGRTKLGQAREVLAAANDESLPEPVRETARQAAAEMDRTGNVNGAHRKVKQAAARAAFDELDKRETELLRDELTARGWVEPTAEQAAEQRRVNGIVAPVLGIVINMRKVIEAHPADECVPLADDLSFPHAWELEECIAWLAALLAARARTEQGAAA